MEIELGIGMRAVPHVFYFDFVSGSFDKTAEDTVNITIKRTLTATAATVRLLVTGGNEAGEVRALKTATEYVGLGRHYTGTGTWVNNGYQSNYTDVVFGIGESSKVASLKIENCHTLEPDRVLTLSLEARTGGCGVSGGSRTITIIDDNIPKTDYLGVSYRNIIDVSDPTKDFDSAVTARTGLTATIGQNYTGFNHLDSPDLVTNGDFTTDGSGWTVGSGWSVSGGTANHLTPGSTDALEQDVGVEVGGYYEINFYISRTAGTVVLYLGGVTGPTYNTTGWKSYQVTSAVSTGNLRFVPDSSFNGWIDRVRVRKRDNTLNDAPKIKAAMTWVCDNGGGVVYLPNGVYGTWLESGGSGAILGWTPSPDYAVSVFGQSKEGVWIYRPAGTRGAEELFSHGTSGSKASDCGVCAVANVSITNNRLRDTTDYSSSENEHDCAITCGASSAGVGYANLRIQNVYDEVNNSDTVRPAQKVNCYIYRLESYNVYRGCITMVSGLNKVYCKDVKTSGNVTHNALKVEFVGSTAWDVANKLYVEAEDLNFVNGGFNVGWKLGCESEAYIKNLYCGKRISGAASFAYSGGGNAIMEIEGSEIYCSGSSSTIYPGTLTFKNTQLYTVVQEGDSGVMSTNKFLWCYESTAETIMGATPGDFGTTTGWIYDATWNVDTTAKNAYHIPGAGATTPLEYDISAVAGRTYRIKTRISRTAGSLTFEIGGVGGGRTVDSSGDFYLFIEASGTGNLKIIPTADYAGYIDWVRIYRYEPAVVTFDNCELDGDPANPSDPAAAAAAVYLVDASDNAMSETEINFINGCEFGNGLDAVVTASSAGYGGKILCEDSTINVRCREVAGTQYYPFHLVGANTRGPMELHLDNLVFGADASKFMTIPTNFASNVLKMQDIPLTATQNSVGGSFADTTIDRVDAAAGVLRTITGTGDPSVSRPAGFCNTVEGVYDRFIQTDSDPPNKHWKCTATGLAGVATWAEE